MREKLANALVASHSKLYFRPALDVAGDIGLRLLFRIFALLALALAVISAVVDAARSLSASSLDLTSLMQGWSTTAPTSLLFIQNLFHAYMPAAFVDRSLNFVLNLPAVAVFAVLAAAFYAIGAKRERPFGQIGIR